MKKHIFAVLILSFILVLPSCLPKINPPFGVWESKDPHILLYIEPEYHTPFNNYYTYIGLYITDEEDIKTFVGMGNSGKNFTIYETESYLDSISVGGESWDKKIKLFSGDFKLTKDGMRYNLSPASKENTGYDEIHFHLLEDYDPPNPDDWFPDGWGPRRTPHPWDESHH
jgi:hypothetical protein